MLEDQKDRRSLKVVRTMSGARSIEMHAIAIWLIAGVLVYVAIAMGFKSINPAGVIRDLTQSIVNER